MNFTKINFLIRRKSIEKRIFKLFTNKKGDIFISFPYCDANKFYAGLAKLPANKKEMQLNPIIEGNACEIPVKFSYHQDGQIHFKPEKSSRMKNSLPYKLAQVTGTPFVCLCGDHFFTLEVEGLEFFKDFIPKKKDEIYMGFQVPDDSKRYKFVFYGGLNGEQIKGKFKGCKILNINRDSDPSLLKVGVYFTPFRDSMDMNEDGNKLMLYALAGMKANKANINEDLYFLYLYAK